MSVQSLERKAKVTLPKDFKELFGQTIDSGGQIRLRLLNDDFMLMNDFVPRSVNGIDDFDYDCLVGECIIPALSANKMYSGENILPFAQSCYGDGLFYLFYKEKKYLFKKSIYSIWMINIESHSPIKMADSVSELVDSEFEIGTWDKIVNYKEKRKLSLYLEDFPKINSNPTLDLDKQFLTINRTNAEPNWEYETYLKLIRVDVPNGSFCTEEITVEHKLTINGFTFLYQLPVLYGNEIGDIWFKEDNYAHYSTRTNHYNFNFFRKMNYIVLTLKQLIEQVSLKLPELDKREVVNLLDQYDARTLVNKSHIEWELSIP
jgi:hypothetical protein